MQEPMNKFMKAVIAMCATVVAILATGCGKYPTGIVPADDYYPLQIGNMWVYGVAPGNNQPGYTVRVAGTAAIAGMDYFILETQYTDRRDTGYLREDSFGRVYSRSLTSSPEKLILDPNAKTDSLLYSTGVATYAIVSRGDTVTTPSGRFSNTLSVGVVDWLLGRMPPPPDIYASGVGPVRQSYSYVLESAVVAGRHYP